MKRHLKRQDNLCRADQGYRRLEVEGGKEEAKPKVPKLSGGSLRVMGGPKQRWEKSRIKELSKLFQAVAVKEVHCE